ncbi:hypothetical protein AB205_0070260 [Aquarana catesbeiana]|uniref:Uncharacterized protein n=1 Tax=Aquarana catesbeiana TaxID=8400 RepID=A0A2G9RVT0_AQUCT|nr:hypothetical protein AB205_0070260 [Aquarana catesbeiana]
MDNKAVLILLIPSPPSCTEESPKLFDHSVGYMLQEDAQRFEGSDDGTQVEERSNVTLLGGGAQEGQETGSHVPPSCSILPSLLQCQGGRG